MSRVAELICGPVMKGGGVGRAALAGSAWLMKTRPWTTGLPLSSTTDPVTAPFEPGSCCRGLGPEGGVPGLLVGGLGGGATGAVAVCPRRTIPPYQNENGENYPG